APRSSPLFPYTTLFRSVCGACGRRDPRAQGLFSTFRCALPQGYRLDQWQLDVMKSGRAREQVERLKHESDFFVPDVSEFIVVERSEEHTSELQSRFDLV